MSSRWLVLAIVLVAAPLRAQDVNDALEKATKDAVKKVAPTVVQILTQGGADMVVTTPKGPTFRKALGPTTGVIVSDDGYIVTSLFNFVNNPTTILVSVPGQAEPLVAKRIANDRSRMLTLLKIEAKGLPVPEASPKSQVHEGQFAIAMGRTLDAKRTGAPSVSVGIISAIGRVWGKALQTDAKISPVNYGGPLVDVQGRIQGILVPVSPQGEDVTAGFEWYDSGIGFAIPFEDVLTVLPRLKAGKDLYKGILGIRLDAGGNMYSGQPKIAMVTADSAASKAGLKVGDVIVEVEGHAIDRLAQMQHILGTRYEGEHISLKYKRGDKVTEIKDLTLVSSLQVVAHPFLGILPLRDDPKLGVEIRYVFPGSPADKAGLKFGERITKYGAGGPPAKLPPIKIKQGDKDKKDVTIDLSKNLQPFNGIKSGRDQFMDILNTAQPGIDIMLEVVGKDGKARTVTVALETLPGSLPGQEWKAPDKVPPGSLGKARDPLEKGKKDVNAGPKEAPKVKDAPKDAKDVAKDEPKGEPKGEKDAPKDAAKDAPKDAAKDAPKFETGLKERTTADGENKYWVYVPKDYDPNYTYGVVCYLHLAGRNKKADAEDLVDLWADYCSEYRLILVLPQSQNAEGWIPSESEFVIQSVQETIKQHSIDPLRVVSHGMGVGGQMAIYLGMNHRELFRGVATVGAVPTTIKDNVPNQRLAFWLAGGELDPLVKSISEARVKLAEKRFSAVFIEMPNRGREYLAEGHVRDLVRWIDALDKE
jgi:S1-C subfamily serine protease